MRWWLPLVGAWPAAGVCPACRQADSRGVGRVTDRSLMARHAPAYRLHRPPPEEGMRMHWFWLHMAHPAALLVTAAIVIVALAVLAGTVIVVSRGVHREEKRSRQKRR